MSRILLLAQDAAPSGCFERLAPVLKDRGHQVLIVMGHGKPIAARAALIGDMVQGTDVVLLGMSSSPQLAPSEVTAAEYAHRLGVPFGFYGDIPGCFARVRKGTEFHKLAAQASFYLGIDDGDAYAAKSVLVHARTFASGNPLREEMAFPKYTREDIRAKLGISSDVALILAPGNKVASLNMMMWGMTIEALFWLQHQGRNVRLVLTPHPGDRTPYAVDGVSGRAMHLYEELVRLSPVPTSIVSADVLSTSDIVPGADLVIGFASSVELEAAYQNIPVITLVHETALRRIEAIQGSRMLESVALGISKQIPGDDTRLLGRTIARLLTEDGFAPMRQRQREKCPRPKERGRALRVIAETLEQIAAT